MTRRAISREARSEYGLLLACARMVLPPDGKERLRALLAQPLDWDWLLAAAERHGLLPLLYTHLKANAADLVPAASMETLRRLFEENLARAMSLTGTLHKVVALLASRDVVAIPYKGPVVAQQLYGNLALRPFADLDLLIRHRDVPCAARLLLESDFHAESGCAIEWSALAEAPTAGQFVFVAEDGALVELHSERTLRHFPRPLDIEWLFANATTVSLAGRDVRTLAPDRLLLALAVHGAKDFWAQLKWICDIAELFRATPSLDWTALWSDARRFGCERMLLLALRLAQDLLGADTSKASGVPHGEPIGSGDPAVASLSAQVAAQLITRDLSGNLGSAPERFLFRARMCSRTWVGLHYALRLTFSPADDDRPFAGLPPALARPFRLLGKYGIARGHSRSM